MGTWEESKRYQVVIYVSNVVTNEQNVTFSLFQGLLVDLEEKDIHTIWQFGNECTKDAVSIHLKGQLVPHVRQGKWKMSIFSRWTVGAQRQTVKV